MLIRVNTALDVINTNLRKEKKSCTFFSMIPLCINIKETLTLQYLCPLKGHTYLNKPVQFSASGLFKYV